MPSDRAFWLIGELQSGSPFLFIFKRTAPPNPQRGTPAGIPRYGAASRRLTYEERESQASAHWYFAFCFSSAQHQQTRTQTKKRWGPALWLWKGLVALARAKLRKQQSKIHSHKEKKKRQFQHGTHKAANKKSRMQKRNSSPAILHNKPNNQRASNLHAAIDRKQPTACGRLCIGQPFRKKRR